MDESQSLKGLFQGMIPTQCELVQGTVISASPLKIQITNDEKLVIGAAITVVPQHLTDYEVEITTNGYGWVTQSSDGHNHAINHGRRKIMVHGALKTGDKVHLLAVQNGKKYFALDRVAG